MDRDLSFYKENPIEYIEDTQNVKLLEYQKEILQKIYDSVKVPSHIIMPKRSGKKFTMKMIDEIIKLKEM